MEDFIYRLALLLTLSWLNRECTCILQKNTAIHDAAIFPGYAKTALKVSYSDLGDFSNLQDVIKDEGFLSMGLFCVKRGAFILYKKPEFNIDSTDGFQIASGENKCFKPSGLVSAQPIGAINSPKEDSITFFSKPNFADIARPNAAKTIGRSFFSTMRGTAKSLVLIGRQNWTITTMKGLNYCIRPVFDKTEKNPICVLPDFKETRIKHTGIRIFRVNKGCSNESAGGNSTIDLTFCHYWGQVPASKEAPFTFEDGLAGRSGMDACSGGGPMEAALKETISILKPIFQNNFEQVVILHWKKMGRAQWKLDLIDSMFDIAKLTIPGDILREFYMNRIRELFIFQLGKAWERIDAEGGEAGAKDERVGMLTDFDFRSITIQTTDCLKLMREDGQETKEKFREAWEDVDDPANLENFVWKSLIRNKDSNIVIEMTWVVANMVGGLCHTLFDYKHNFWALYIHLVTNLYLKPVIPEWQQHIEDIDILLGGDMDVQYNKLAMFASLALFSANSLEPLQRPKGLQKKRTPPASAR